MADGTSMANMLAMAALIAPGDEVLVEHPGLRADGRGRRASRRRGPAVHPRRARTSRIDPEAVEAALTPRTRLIVLTNLHNPTGNLADEATLRAVGALAERDRRACADRRGLSRRRAAGAAERGVCSATRFVCTSSLTKVYGLCGPALRLDPRRAGRWPSGCGG